MTEALKEYLLRGGAAVAGVASLKGVLDEQIAHLTRAVSIGVVRNLNEDTLSILAGLQKKTVQYLRERGNRFLCIPPDSDRLTGTFISKLYPMVTHKMAATCAGIGWIGKNGLLISPEHGPRLSLATVLTDAPLESDTPFDACMCGECSMCVEHCPSEALQGEEWSRERPFPLLVDTGRCRGHKKMRRTSAGKPNCGLCITICPYGRKQFSMKGRHTMEVRLEDDRWVCAR
jgi:epoxyqueuosine reductase QueG